MIKPPFPPAFVLAVEDLPKFYLTTLPRPNSLHLSISALESHMATSASLSRQIRACETDVSVTQATEAMKQLAKQALARQQLQMPSAFDSADEESPAGRRDMTRSDGGGGVGDAASPDSQDAAARISLVGKLQRLEMERRLQSEEISNLTEQLQLQRSLAAQVG